MESFEIHAEPREDVGKGASRRLRKAGKVPGIVYGTGKDVTLIALDQDSFRNQLENEAFYSHILTLNVGKHSDQVVLKDLQRHPFKRNILHVDFQRIAAREKLTMRVPLHFMNESTCPGVKNSGGVVSHIITDLEISCLPKDLPEYLEVDLAGVELNETVHLSDIRLPDGVEISALLHGGDDSQPVASVHLPRAEEVDEEAEEALEVEAAAAGEEPVEAPDEEQEAARED